MGSWPVAFDRFRHSPEFTDENLCLMLASMHRQAVHLLEHPTGGNWLLMEMNGLCYIAVICPFFKESGKWSSFALSSLEIYALSPFSAHTIERSLSRSPSAISPPV